MRFKVELHRDVVWYLRNKCTEAERELFREQFERVRREPIEHSQAIYDPKISKYMLRFVRFGEHLAVFEYDPGRGRIRFLTCRKPGKRKPTTGGQNGTPPPGSH